MEDVKKSSTYIAFIIASDVIIVKWIIWLVFHFRFGISYEKLEWMFIIYPLSLIIIILFDVFEEFKSNKEPY